MATALPARAGALTLDAADIHLAQTSPCPDGAEGQPRVPGGGLDAHEQAGGHVLERHVNVSNDDLLARVGGPNGPQSASRFFDRATAERVIWRELDAQQEKISEWLNDPGSEGVLTINGDQGTTTGVLVKKATQRAEAVQGVRIVLRKDPAMPTGWRIQTAYPVEAP